MKYFITATSEKGKPSTKGGQEKIEIEIERDRKLVARIIVNNDGIFLYPVEGCGRAAIIEGTHGVITQNCIKTRTMCPHACKDRELDA